MKHAREVTAEDKHDFVELLLDGYDAHSAARHLGITSFAMGKHRRAHTQYYDADFAEACDQAENSPHRARTRIERLDGGLWEAVDRGEKWAIEKALVTYHPDFEYLRHTNFRVHGQIEHNHKMLIDVRNLSKDELMKALAEAREREQAPLALLPPPVDVA